MDPRSLLLLSQLPVRLPLPNLVLIFSQKGVMTMISRTQRRWAILTSPRYRLDLPNLPNPINHLSRTSQLNRRSQLNQRSELNRTRKLNPENLLHQRLQINRNPNSHTPSDHSLLVSTGEPSTNENVQQQLCNATEPRISMQRRPGILG